MTDHCDRHVDLCVQTQEGWRDAGWREIAMAYLSEETGGTELPESEKDYAHVRSVE